MTSRRVAATAESGAAETPIATNPSSGGSYLREPDGTLNRVEFTDELPAAPQPETPEGTTDAD